MISPRPAERGAECAIVEDRLPALLEHDVEAGELLLLRAHLEDCAGCRRAHDELVELTAQLAADAPPAAWLALARRRVDDALDDDLSPVPVAASRHVAPRRGLLAFAALTGIAWWLGPPESPALTRFAALPLAARACVEPLSLLLASDFQGFDAFDGQGTPADRPPPRRSP
jgi:hypothetical protein